MNRYQDRYQDRYQYGYTQSYQDNYPTTKGDENKACTDYYKKGCTMAVTDLVSETVLIVASVLLAIGVLQVRFKIIGNCYQNTVGIHHHYF